MTRDQSVMSCQTIPNLGLSHYSSRRATAPNYRERLDSCLGKLPQRARVGGQLLRTVWATVGARRTSQSLPLPRRLSFRGHLPGRSCLRLSLRRGELSDGFRTGNSWAGAVSSPSSSMASFPCSLPLFCAMTCANSSSPASPPCNRPSASYMWAKDAGRLSRDIFEQWRSSA